MDNSIIAYQQTMFGSEDEPIFASRRNAQKLALLNSESNEWYTPEEYIEAARWVMGSIDLDPASTPGVNKIVRAGRIYTMADDGLAASSPWAGNVWLNPPYGKWEGQSNQALWSRRLIYEFTTHNINSGILLVNAVPDREWFAALWGYEICFVDHRIQFWRFDKDGNREFCTQPTNPNCFVYFGQHQQRFRDRFNKYGPIAKRVA